MIPLNIRDVVCTVGLLGLLAGCDGFNITVSVDTPLQIRAIETRTVAMPEGSSVQVFNDFGTTRVVVDPAVTEASIEITRIATARTLEEAEALLPQIVVAVTEPAGPDGMLRIDAPRPVTATADGSLLGATITEGGIIISSLPESAVVAQVTLRITLPPGHGVEVSQGVGNIRATALDAASSLSTTTGSIRSISAVADLAVETDAGGVSIESHRGSLQAIVNSGSLAIEVAALAPGQEIVGRLREGQIALTLPGDVNADLQALTEDGDVDFRIYGFDVISRLTATPSTVEATLNGGGASIDLWTESGDVAIGAE